MPLIAGIGTLIAAAVRAFIAYKIAATIFKVTTRVMIFGLIITAYLVILSQIQTSISSLSASAPPFLSTCYSWFVPNNFLACITVIVTVQLIIWAWHWQKYAFEFIARGVS